ncbi:MAG: VOC family protein [Chloroflexi bacterium]|nr:VOC family protein [Chloroflexota bacterium]
MNQTQTAERTEFSIHPAAHIGYVSLSVANLENQIDFYRQNLGFQLHWRDGKKAGLGAGEQDLLRLTELPGARSVRGVTGLYHTAFLFPTRLALAQVIENIVETRTRIQGGSNHGTHLALYLPDAEGNGIELAWDFPRPVWEPIVEKMRAGKMQELMNVARQPLDIDGLLAEAQSASTPWAGLPAGTSVGHVHLHVADLHATKQFGFGA